MPTEDCWLIPELKAVMENYEDPIPALSFLYFMVDPLSPYMNLPEDDKEETIISDYPGEYTSEDDVIITALSKLTTLYETPLMRFYKNAKKGLERLGEYLATTSITEGRDGNLAAYSAALTRMAKISQDAKLLEKMVEEENNSETIRGNKKDSWDI